MRRLFFNARWSKFGWTFCHRTLPMAIACKAKKKGALNERLNNR